MLDAVLEPLDAVELIIYRGETYTATRFVEPPTRTEGKNDSLAVVISYLSEVMSFDDESALAEFLSEDLDVIPMILTLHQRCSALFPDLKLFGRFPIDYEDESPPPLYITVGSSLPVDEAEARLEKLEEEWWLDQDLCMRSRILIDISFA